MPTRRVADANHITPYLTHVVTHHGQVTLVPPDNAGRIRQQKPTSSAKPKPRPRQDRTARPEDEIRFNTGPRSLRNLATSRGARRGTRPGRQGRRDDLTIEIDNDSYPDYPPPSFQEAMASPPISVSSSNLTNGPSSDTSTPPITPVRAASRHGNTSDSPVRGPSPTSQSNISDDDRDGELDGSFETIETSSVRAEQPPSGPLLEEQVRKYWRSRHGTEFPEPTSHWDNSRVTDPPRGRARQRSRSALDLDPDDEIDNVRTPTHETPKRRPMSLSPLRTFFGSKALNSHDRSISAHASPVSSPYSSRSSIPFLSTTSLKMSLGSASFLKLPTVPPSHNERNRLFHFRSKESLQSWEVVESESLGIESTLEAADIPRPKSPVNGRRTSDSPPPSVNHGDPNPSLSTTVPSESTSQTSSCHPLSLRDRKNPIDMYMQRPRRQRQPQSHAPTPPPPPAPAGPVLTTVRTRKADKGSNCSCALALEDRVPHPVDQGAPAGHSPMPSSNMAHAHSTQQVSQPLGYENHVSRPVPMPIYNSHMDCEESQLSRVADGLRSLHVQAAQSPPSPVQAAPSATPFDDTSSFRRHYPGRPLPRPPRAHNDPLQLVDEQSNFSAQRSQSPCPEGVLIDLDDTSLDAQSVSSSSTLWTGSGDNPQPNGTSNARILDTLSEDPDVSLITPVAPASSSAPFSELTDLDVLVSRLSEGHSNVNGTDYEAMLMLSDFIGPATSVGNAPARLPASPPQQLVAEDGAPENEIMNGNVEVTRSRTTKDGRSKIKLVLGDASVDRCGICLSQFKDGDRAQSGSVCRHAFHEKCLTRWVSRNRTCPMCRVPFTDLL